MNQGLATLREYILKHSKGAISPKDSIFFWFNKQLVDPTPLIRDFLKYKFTDSEKDGWMHLKVTTQ